MTTRVIMMKHYETTRFCFERLARCRCRRVGALSLLLLFLAWATRVSTVAAEPQEKKEKAKQEKKPEYATNDAAY